MGFIHRTVIINGKKMQMGNAQCLHVIKAGRNAGAGLGAGFDEAQKLSLVFNA